MKKVVIFLIILFFFFLNCLTTKNTNNKIIKKTEISAKDSTSDINKNFIPEKEEIKTPPLIEENKNYSLLFDQDIKKSSNDVFVKNEKNTEIKDNNKQSDSINKNKIREKKKEKRKTNPSYRLILNLRRRTLLALKGQSKSANTMILLGVTNLEFLWDHLESTFKPGMTRENHGKVWHVDHILPCANFDLSKHEEQLKCFHYSNLQALFVHENLSKGSKILSPDSTV